MEDKKVIAIIEDDPISVKILHRRLLKQGFLVHLAYDGRAGLELIQNLEPDLVIMDMLLPRVHGLELCRKVKREPRFEQLPILLVSGVYRSEQTISDAARAGADGFFNKPFDLPAIQTRINELLNVSSREVARFGPEPEHDTRESENFREHLWGQLAEIEAHWDGIHGLQNSGPQLEVFQDKAHALAGAGAVFGFPDMGRWAEGLAQFLGHLLARKSEPDHDERGRIANYLDQIRVSATAEYEGNSEQNRDETADYDEGTSTNGFPRRICVIEDDVVFANELAIKLEIFGYQVDVFSSRADFSESGVDRQLDALITRFTAKTFPMNSLKEELNRIPLILIGPDNKIETRLAALRAGGDAFFPRPLPTEALLDRLQELLELPLAPPFRVLVMEDNDSIGLFIKQVLKGMLVRLVSDPMEISDQLTDFAPDLILVEANLPGCQGFELAQLIREDLSYVGVPIIYLSEDQDDFSREETRSLGVDGFLLKPVEASLLLATVTNRVQRFRDLRNQMVTDPLTGLFNYGTIKEQLGTEIERARRFRIPCTLGIIDLDNLGRINTRYGYTAGDTAMKNLALILTRRLRRSDSIGRFEGATLLVLLTKTDGVQSLQVMDSIRQDFARLTLQTGQAEFRASFSCGLASYPRFRKTKALIEAGQRALNKAKDIGRNRVELAN